MFHCNICGSQRKQAGGTGYSNLKAHLGAKHAGYQTSFESSSGRSLQSFYEADGKLHVALLCLSPLADRSQTADAHVTLFETSSTFMTRRRRWWGFWWATTATRISLLRT
ncbi:hypothetical protein JG687_00014695, partial [Phytophthora cactorum]